MRGDIVTSENNSERRLTCSYSVAFFWKADEPDNTRFVAKNLRHGSVSKHDHDGTDGPTGDARASTGLRNRASGFRFFQAQRGAVDSECGHGGPTPLVLSRLPDGWRQIALYQVGREPKKKKVGVT